MTQNALFSDDEATDPQAAPGFVTQILALGTAACVGVGLFFGSVLVGIGLFFVVLVGMNVDAGTGWVVKLRKIAERRDCRVLRQLLSPQ